MIDHQQEERACENLCASAQTPAGLATTEAVVLFRGRAWNVLGVKKCHPSRMVHIKVLLLTEILQYPNHGFSPTFLLSTEILQVPKSPIWPQISHWYNDLKTCLSNL
jgi:hypothetical protein